MGTEIMGRTKVITVFFAALAVCGSVLADELFVPGGYSTIQAAIDVSKDGDMVIVDPNTYYENINFKGKNIVLTSTNPADEDIVGATIVDGNDMNSVVTFAGTENSSCVLRGFTITNGYAELGGGICGNGAMATIENNVIVGNWVEKPPPLLIPQCYGAGLYDCDGLIQNNIVTGNITAYMGHGGGLYDCDGTIRNNVISGNFADCGGGLRLCDGIILNNLLVGNYGVYGGAIEDCNAIIGNCVVVDNRYEGIKNCSGTIKNCTVVRNRNAGLDNCTGIIKNCIIWQNLNGTGQPEQMINCSTPIYSCLEDWDGSGIGNISADPCFADTSSSDPKKWDYHLKSQAGRWDVANEIWVFDDVNSPCIDAGDPNSNWTAELWPHGKCINIGAYGGMPQASMSLSDVGNIADLNNNDLVDYTDLMLFTTKWLCQEALLSEDLSRNEAVNLIDFAIFANSWLWTN